MSDREAHQHASLHLNASLAGLAGLARPLQVSHSAASPQLGKIMGRKRTVISAGNSPSQPVLQTLELQVAVLHAYIYSCNAGVAAGCLYLKLQCSETYPCNAGVAGYTWVAVLHVWLGLSFKSTLLLANLTSVSWLCIYHGVLPTPKPQAVSQLHVLSSRGSSASSPPGPASGQPDVEALGGIQEDCDLHDLPPLTAQVMSTC